jgi:hypothetical protein
METFLANIKGIEELRNKGRLKAAYLAIKGFISEHPGHPDLLNIEGEINYQLGNKEDAKKMFLELIEKFPEHPKILNNLGVILWSEGDIEKAINYFKEAVKYDPHDRIAILNLGDILISIKKFEEAEEIYTNYLYMYPEDEEIYDIIEKLTAKLPVIFIHQGDSEHIEYILKQAKKYNPASDIFLIGDETNNHYEEVIHDDISKYFKEAEEFSEFYVHLSPYPYEFELICFNRWFILKEFLETHNINRCVYSDSDVLIYCNVTEEWKNKFFFCDFTLSQHTCGHFTFINSLNILKDFCNFLMNLYRNKEKTPLFSEFINKIQPQNPGASLCDMSILNLYRNIKPDRIGETSVIINGSIYDHNINKDDGFETEEGKKKIYWIDNEPYGKDLKSGEMIKYNK